MVPPPAPSNTPVTSATKTKGRTPGPSKSIRNKFEDEEDVQVKPSYHDAGYHNKVGFVDLEASSGAYVMVRFEDENLEDRRIKPDFLIQLCT